jgi:hypothetical protein
MLTIVKKPSRGLVPIGVMLPSAPCRSRRALVIFVVGTSQHRNQFVTQKQEATRRIPTSRPDLN